MSSGKHTVVVRAWDSSGSYGDQTLTVTVNTSKPTVTISTPSNNASVGSPMTLQASASPSSGQKITGWWVYVDSKATYNGGANKSINTNLSMSTGTHTVLARAWDSSGNYGDQTITVTVSKPTVSVTSPTSNSNVSSPMTVKASATPGSGNITGWWIYLDGDAVYNGDAVKSINTNISAASGTHTLVVRAWDSSGAYADQTLTVTVTQGVAVNITSPTNGAKSPVTVSANATSTHEITGWKIYVDSVPWCVGYNASETSQSLSIGSGTHGVLVRAWDSTGAYGDQTITVTTK